MELALGGEMSQPRQYLHDSTYLITRRTLLRQYTLKPDPRVEQIWLYCLAFYAQRHNIDIHSFVLMCTHEHLNATDRRGKMGRFLRDFHRTVTKALQALLHIEGNLWEDKPPSVVQLRTLQSFVEESAYIIVNPVEAEAVEHSRQWPGLIVLADEVGNKTFTIKRPDVYFSPRNKQWPESITLQLTMPNLNDYSKSEVRQLIANEAERLEHEARKRVRAQGRSFMGVKKIKQVSRLKRATKPNKKGDRNPTFAVGRNNPEAYAAAALAVREFRRLYREAFTDWRSGNRNALFPPGTVAMSAVHRACIAAAA